MNEIEKKVIEKYLEGNSIRVVSELLNYNKNVVYKILKDNNLTRNRSEALINRSITDIHKINISKAKRGMPNYKKRKILDEIKIIDIYIKQGNSSIKIAKEFNCSDTLIRNILMKNNIKLRELCISNKGHTAWNKGMKGLIKSWNRGIKTDRNKYPNMGHFEKHSEETKEKIKSKKIEQYEDPNSYYHNKDYLERRAKAVIKSLIKRPTSFEKKIAELCIENSLPFIYTGDGRFLINFKNPDFVNEQDKVVIEVFYSYFKIRDYGSVESYKEYCRKKYNSAGWRVIFIDENEIDVDNWKELCLNKINGEIKW